MAHATERLVDTVKSTVDKAASPASDAGRAASGATSDLAPLQQSLQHLTGAIAGRAVSALTDKVGGTAERLTDYAEGGGGNLLGAVTGRVAGGESPLKAAMGAGLANVKDLALDKFDSVKESLTGGKGKGGGGGKKLALTNIVEQIDVGVPVQLAYDQWTQFTEFPRFTKKVEQVEQKEEDKLAWTAKVFWSRRTWESTIVDQVPDEHIVWKSKGAKGFIDGAVTFHELAPSLTRIILVLEYHPHGFFEKTGNLWRAQGRRARLELKHFQRHVMTHTALHSDDVEGWRGEIHDGDVIDEADRDTTENDTTDDEATDEDTRPGGGGRDEDDEGAAEEDDGTDEENESAAPPRRKRASKPAAEAESGERRAPRRKSPAQSSSRKRKQESRQ
ncbi:SRPBCC family protein [Rhodococcus triatomae]|nr:putative integral membrane protein [Rhodococcus triatomae BKS 15-14]